MSRNTILVLNVVIVSAYVAIALLSSSPWIMFAGFLLLAVLIRCATLCWAGVIARSEATFSRKAAVGVVTLNLPFGLIFAAALLGVLYWLGQLWLSGVKIIVPVAAVFIAYKSTFPFFARSKP
jgi:hypothetical protein